MARPASVEVATGCIQVLVLDTPHFLSSKMPLSRLRLSELMVVVLLLCLCLCLSSCAHDSPWPPLPLACPCSNTSLCEPLEITFPREKEVFGFQSQSKNYSAYNWDVLTTLALFGGMNDTSIICKAHESSVRLVHKAATMSGESGPLNHPETIPQWVNDSITFAKELYLDGIFIDYETPTFYNETLNQVLTTAVKALYEGLKAANPYYQLTFDVAWSPSCIDGRCYDYAALAEYVDFFFIMAYDERSQMWPSSPKECVAGPSSSLPGALQGMWQYTEEMGVPGEKLVLGVPWNGVSYPCLDVRDNGTVCQIPEVPFRGVNCSDSPQKGIGIGTLEAMAANSSIDIIWDNATSTSYFNYAAPDGNTTAQPFQAWLDTPKSLALKYKAAKAMGLLGVGIWNVNMQDGMNTTLRSAMWDGVAEYYG
eukprot:TRINITY_DN5670_c3_g1_i1.p1 TRINITY_DN5670_c3_g1~~TRINITY_DN5670_c3_g1_i1.p1  ORF type:complete len:423 (-),score=53.04 TRINITY_DN5670_c3_g1_i1:120-1388(-)